MGRPSKFQAAATALAELAHREWLDGLAARRAAWRICPATRHSHRELACDDCQDRICHRMQAKGLDDAGQPLPFNARPACEARTRAGTACRKKVVPGKQRCRFHGGLSTGPKTAEGRARIAEAQKMRWQKPQEPPRDET